MHKTLETLAFVCLLLGILASTPVLAENSQEFGDYVVHYNALGTDFLAPDVAKHYGITRSKNRGMINISVLKKSLGVAGQPVHAQVSARAVNLNNQTRTLDVREVDDKGAIYYVAEFPVTNRETLEFTVEVIPKGDTPKTVKFRQQFFVE